MLPPQCLLTNVASCVVIAHHALTLSQQAHQILMRSLFSLVEQHKVALGARSFSLSFLRSGESRQSVKHDGGAPMA